MNGMELSRDYYAKVLRPFLDSRPEWSSRCAVGLVGEGSECFCYDDELSRDHDWGVRVCIWLNVRDYRSFGEVLAAELERLPNVFHDRQVFWRQERSGVLEIGAFYRKYLRKETAPQTVGEWLGIPEAYLATASNGAVFSDPAGEFSAVWNELRLGYPEDIRLKKLARRCMTIGQAGQYNYPRLVKRGDIIASQLALDELIRVVISAAYLLNNRYTPFYKWMYRGLRELEVVGNELSALLEQLEATENKRDMIERICEVLISEFHRQCISEETETYMVAQGETIHSHIRMEALRNTDPWMDCL